MPTGLRLCFTVQTASKYVIVEEEVASQTDAEDASESPEFTPNGPFTSHDWLCGNNLVSV